MSRRRLLRDGAALAGVVAAAVAGSMLGRSHAAESGDGMGHHVT
jgi:hypothetical protein